MCWRVSRSDGEAQGKSRPRRETFREDDLHDRDVHCFQSASRCHPKNSLVHGQAEGYLMQRLWFSQIVTQTLDDGGVQQ